MPKRLLRRAPQIAIAAGLLILVVLLGYAALSGATSAAPADLPASIAGLALDSATRGADAVASVTQLHGKAFDVVSGAEGQYGGGQVTIWSAQARDATAAAGLVSAMHGRIAEGNSPFEPLADRQDGGRTVYALDGMGQKHFYFQSARQVVWVAADAGIAERALEEALAFYP